MMMPSPAAGRPQNAQQRHLLKLFNELDEAGRRSLLDYAEFLQTRTSQETMAEPEPEPLLEPKLIPRPENESVVKAIKRLSASFSMLPREALFNETSSLMMAHVMQGRSAPDVIDELEALFEAHYQKYRQGG
ncbi:hypothetical protein [endosymbiont of Ridgeia piscesae]|jgi:hypothetical protein|uniref:Crp/Fnr family transcriptional regulator n=1 Tax=endosymbiont of Ridgeia piscesae TaxID=54398 RepID=A0A0T5YSX1_9GAMM|nr:hypothetical protein [endosymbiont of Ridgeia piscesae]KRT53656.1 hypothetical protein Ga0074115_10691 [endosymbiont of Ridgeia piscesae]KRT57000.1 hypothetical protein Ga0076813_10775 [endosymbiont of Ridgeia piscesae]